MMRFIRSAFVIGRRDFAATVLSKAFIFFLLGPLFPLLFGGVFAGIGTNVASQAKRPVVAVIAPQAEFDQLQAARGRIADAVGEDPLIDLVGYRARIRHRRPAEAPARHAPAAGPRGA